MPTIILPGGDKKRISADETVNKILFELMGEKSVESHLVFSGKKLPLESKLNDIEFLNEDTNVYLVYRPTHKNPPETVLHADEIRRLLKIIGQKFRRNDYQKIKEYISNSENLQKILKNHPALYHDQAGFDAICDFRFLVDLLSTNSEFAEAHPHCTNVFKEVVEAQLANHKSSPFDPPTDMDDDDIPNYLPQRTAIPSTSGLPITPQMLAQALNASFNTVASPQVALADPRQTYAAQLQQMLEFGFTDQDANLEAIQVCEGNVERALEYLVIRLEQMDHDGD